MRRLPWLDGWSLFCYEFLILLRYVSSVGNPPGRSFRIAEKIREPKHEHLWCSMLRVWLCEKQRADSFKGVSSAANWKHKQSEWCEGTTAGHLAGCWFDSASIEPDRAHGFWVVFRERNVFHFLSLSSLPLSGSPGTMGWCFVPASWSAVLAEADLNDTNHADALRLKPIPAMIQTT